MWESTSNKGTVFKVYDFREIEEPEKFNVDDFEITVELDYCPFCGIKGVLNQDNRGYFGWCSICDCKGPSHWDWVRAAKMWNDRKLKTVVDCKELNHNKFRTMSLFRFNEESKEYAESVIKEETAE